MEEWMKAIKTGAEYSIVGNPFNVQHNTHVAYDPSTSEFSGNFLLFLYCFFSVLFFFLKFCYFFCLFVCFIFKIIFKGLPPEWECLLRGNRRNKTVVPVSSHNIIAVHLPPVSQRYILIIFLFKLFFKFYFYYYPNCFKNKNTDYSHKVNLIFHSCCHF